MSNWYVELAPATRNAVLMVMTRAQRAPDMSTFGLIDVNIGTFVNVSIPVIT